jgi:nucleotide-binding universal stress UspA family protein
MQNIKRIVLAVDFPNMSLPVVHQAATLARHFHTEIVMLHAVTAESHAAGVPESSSELASWDLLARVLQEAQKQQDQTLAAEIDGLPIRRIVVQGDPAWAIMKTAQQEDATVIIMSSHGGMFNQFLLGSVTARVLQWNGCPIWTGAHVEQTSGPGFAIHNVLCAIDLGPRSEEAVSWAARLATEFGARLFLIHVTAAAELWGPGGDYVVPKWKESLVSDASKRVAKLQQKMGTKAEVFIGSGDVPKVLADAAIRTKADVLVAGCYPYGVNLRTHDYAIICAVPIPVLSV